MYNNPFADCNHVLSEEEIGAFEKEFGFEMPSAIRAHYLAFNGGYPEKSVFTAADGECYTVNYFYAINGEEGHSLNKNLPLLRDENIMPQWLIPLADDEGGNLFCYSLRPDDNAIYYYDHEFEYGENPENHVCRIADSIAQFIGEMCEEED